MVDGARLRSSRDPVRPGQWAALQRRESSALTVSSKIVLLEQKSTKPITRQDVIESHGSPRRTVATTWGEFLDYRTVGFDIRDGRVITTVFFDNARY